MSDLTLLVPDNKDEEILPLYAEHGEECVDHLFNEFSFVIYDKSSNSHFAARDPVGLRPLYYTFHDDRFFFPEI